MTTVSRNSRFRSARKCRAPPSNQRNPGLVQITLPISTDDVVNHDISLGIESGPRVLPGV